MSAGPPFPVALWDSLLPEARALILTLQRKPPGCGPRSGRSGSRSCRQQGRNVLERLTGCCRAALEGTSLRLSPAGAPRHPRWFTYHRQGQNDQSCERKC